MRVDIYITTKFNGRASCGKGAYGIVLETVMGGKERCRMHLAGWRSLSYQKLSVLAAAEAMRCMNWPAEVHIHTDNVYAAGMIQKGRPGKAHERIWKMFFEAAGRMESVEAEFVKEHKYRQRLLKEIAGGKYPVTEDRQEGLDV